MKSFCAFVSFVLVSIAVMAGDYAIVRDFATSPGGGTGTNVVKFLVRPAGSGAELIEFHAFGGGTADTATVTRVSTGGFLTNTICVLTATRPVSIMLTSSNFTSVAYSWVSPDYLFVTMTGTNKVVCAPVWRVHQDK